VQIKLKFDTRKKFLESEHFDFDFLIEISGFSILKAESPDKDFYEVESEECSYYFIEFISVYQTHSNGI